MSDLLDDFTMAGSGIFGEGALSDDPSTGEASASTAQPTALVQVSSDQSAPMPSGAVDPQTDAAFFVRDAIGVSYIRPEMAANANAIIDQLFAAVVPPTMLPAGAPVDQFRAYALAPASIAASAPAYIPLAKVIESERTAGHTFFLLPKRIFSAAPAAAPLLMLASSDAAGGALAAQSPSLFRHFPAAPAAQPKKAGMNVAMTALVGVAVLGGGYALTRLIQKKPLLPNRK